MSKLKITLDGKESVIVGSDELSTLQFHLVFSASEPNPTIHATGYKMKNDRLDTRLDWVLPSITKASTVRIDIEPRGNAVPPTETDNREGYKVKEERLYIKQQINKVKRINFLLQAKIKELTEVVGPKEEDICIFCGAVESESRVLISGPVANICNVCVGYCQDAIEQKLNA